MLAGGSLLRPLSDRTAIEKWLRRDAAVHLYEIGDLDDFFWPHTTWYGLASDTGRSFPTSEALTAVALLYTATDLPVLLIMARESSRSHARVMLAELRSVLPPRFYAHLVPGIVDALGSAWTTEPHGLHDRMILVDRASIDAVDTREVEALTPAHDEEVRAFFRRAYPGNWFDSRMLETRTYFGMRRPEDGVLVSLAGVHVVSPAYRVAALGNIATDPSMRGQGLARIVTAAVCKRLLEDGIDPIGLNVESANASAISVYRKLGFERVASYEEFACAAAVPAHLDAD
jgi:ribosomal protein S18 acetylase RimI-like enzyme